jgi:diguanylate cyclase (GGDEF)-like protein/putative nucleotidyltransferase with HDIG domain
MTSAAGIAVFACFLHRLLSDTARLDWMLLLIFLVSLVAWRAEMFALEAKGKVALIITFICIGALMLGCWAATVLASIAVMASSVRAVKRPAAIGINLAAMNLAVLGASLLASGLFGSLNLLAQSPEQITALALALVALVSHLVNNLIVIVCAALWRKADLVRTFIASFAGVVAAGLISKAAFPSGFYVIFTSLPVLLLAHIAYKTYFERAAATNNHIERLTRLHLATIESLTMAIDAKDGMARGHIRRVRDMAEMLARAVGYPEDQMEGLKAAALLHDIGKLAIPEHILNKQSKLSPAEFAKVMIHPVVGADILSNVEFPYEVVPIVKHHHEKFDGTGYPSGLKGEEIPLGARILAIVDCYDALTHNRAYRPRYLHEQAIELMRRESGRSFDPLLLDKFLELLGSTKNNIQESDLRPKLIPVQSLDRMTTGRLLDPWSPAEKALRNISAAQREVLSLYEISQTLGSTLKLSEVLPIIAAKLENITNFTSAIIYLAEVNFLRAAYASGKYADLLKGITIAIGAGEAGWVAKHKRVFIGAGAVTDIRAALGHTASRYRSTAIFPLLRGETLVGALALYCEQGCGYTADDVRLLETISCHAATAVYNALIFERTQESALTDNLTGLPNSRYLYSFFDQERSRAERQGETLVLLMMDLEGFKKVNDTYGHHVGDEILRCIGQIIRRRLRLGDTLIRYAGDEFVAVLHQATPEVVRELKRRVQHSVDEFAYEVRPARMARVGISIGYATYGEDGSTISELMKVADRRMYEDKATRKHYVEVRPVARLSVKDAC